eukprot:gene11075-12334_t
MLTLLLLASFLGTLSAQYSLRAEYSGKSFFDGYNFVTYDDPTHGYVNYVDQNTAWAEGLVYVNGDNQVYIGVDYQNVASGRGRDSVRLESKDRYTHGLFVIDLMHMPHGCGTWPAFWTCGSDWPNNGEIDIIEQVHDETVNLQTLHTSPNCAMPDWSSASFTGSWASTNCDVYANNNAGCSIVGNANSFGSAFNANKGGVYAMEWTDSFIQVFFFPRDRVPGDVYSNDPNPNNWGMPVGKWLLGDNCSPNHFSGHQIIFDNTFCGDWAGSVWYDKCGQYASQSCQDYVKYNPYAFQDAYWLVNFVKVFAQG